jgi:small nuclear ribonucleoprotein (snRNP)-like protein
MNFKKDSICIGLIGCLLLAPLNDVAAYPKPATPSNLNSVKQQVEQFGVGAEVKIKLAGGEKLGGNLQAIDDQGFVLDRGQQKSYRRITYDQVARVRLASLVYRASGAPDPIEASRVVAGLGVGHHIVVKTTEGREYHGNLQMIGEDRFVMMTDHPPTSVPIAYTQVHYVEQNLSKGAKIVIVVTVVLAIVVVVAAVVVKAGCKGYC